MSLGYTIYDGFYDVYFRHKHWAWARSGEMGAGSARGVLTLLSAPDLYTASARFRVDFPLEYSPKVYQSTEPKRQETIY